MADARYFSIRELNPDQDFVLHGRSTAYWQKKGYLSNSALTGTTARLSQHAIYNADNYRDQIKMKKYATSMTDLANNLEVLSGEVDDTLRHGVTLHNDKIDREILQEVEMQRALRKEIKAADFKEPTHMETIRGDMTEDQLLNMYEKHVSDMDTMSGKPISPRESQWYVNPNHIGGTSQAPTLQSIGKTYREGQTVKFQYSDKDRRALDHFPVTLGSSYDMCAHDYPASEPLNATAPPSMRRAKSAHGLRQSCLFRTPDRSFKDNQKLEKMYLMTQEAPAIGASTVYLTSPHQLVLGKLRLERLRLEESKLLQLKRLEELERIRGPKEKWYMSKGPDFHYESAKNTSLIRTNRDFQDMLDYREDLLRSSYENLKKYNTQPLAA